MGFSERRLLQKAKAGDRMAFGQLVTAYQDNILYLIYDFVGNYEDAKDLAQDVFIKAYERINQFEERSRFSTWIHRIAINQALDFKRRYKKVKVQDLESSFVGRKEYSDDLSFQSIEQHIERQELRSLMNIRLNELSDHQRTVVILKYFHHYNTEEISEMMHCSTATVRTHLFRAIQHLRKSLSVDQKSG